MKKKILIFGATSEIAKACAFVWSKRDNDLFLVARNENKLELLKKELSRNKNSKIYSCLLDLNFYERHIDIINQADKQLNGFDIVLIAHGTLPNQKNCEKNINEAIQTIKTNAISVLSILSHVAKYFENKKKGNIAFISSVAGDRGRASNYVYGSSKSLVNEFMSGLRQRLSSFNIAVTTLKLGFVDTPMTVSFKKGVLWSDPKKVAKQIVSAIDENRDEVYIPSFWRLIMFIIKRIPNKIFKKLNI